MNALNDISRKSLAVATCACAMLASAARADVPPDKVVLSAYENAADGAIVLAGNYEEAIRRLTHRSSDYMRDTIAGSTNLCVSYIMTQQWEPASSACTEAVEEVRAETVEPGLIERIDHNRMLALAYSNRAVLNYLRAASQRATKDMTAAHALAPQLSCVTQNWKLLGEHPQSTRVASVVVNPK